MRIPAGYTKIEPQMRLDCSLIVVYFRTPEDIQGFGRTIYMTYPQVTIGARQDHQG